MCSHTHVHITDIHYACTRVDAPRRTLTRINAHTHTQQKDTGSQLTKGVPLQVEPENVAREAATHAVGGGGVLEGVAAADGEGEGEA